MEDGIGYMFRFDIGDAVRLPEGKRAEVIGLKIMGDGLKPMVEVQYESGVKGTLMTGYWPEDQLRPYINGTTAHVHG